jgi:hypothetical protein
MAITWIHKATTAKDIRTSAPLFHKHGEDFSSVSIAGWKGDLERIYQCDGCHALLDRGKLATLEDAEKHHE